MLNRRPTNSRKINMECDIRSKSYLCVDVKKYDPTPQGLNRETTICSIDETKFTDSVGESIRKKTSHK